MKRIIVLVFALGTLAALGTGVAFAHAKLDTCTPAVSSTVATAPSQIKCVFSEEIDTKLSTMSVFDARNTQVDDKDAKVDLDDPDRKTLLVSLDASKMKNGVYTVKYHTVTPDDGGITDGEFQFTVGSGPTPGPTKEAITEATATPAPTNSVTPTTLPTTGGETNNAFVVFTVFGLAILALGLATVRFVKR